MKEDTLLKTFGIVAAGVFAGAIVMQIVHERCPDCLDKFHTKVGDLAHGFREEFKKGYRSVAGPVRPAEA